MADKNYPCKKYREEMILLSLKKRLESPELTDIEKKQLQEEIRKAEKKVGID